MTHFNRLAKFMGMTGAAAIASLVALPGLAQVNPNPSILSEPNYDGNPATRQAPSTTPSLSGVNPNPSIFSESRYDGIPSGVAPVSALSATSMQMSMLDQQFARMAAHSDQFEIRSSQLALEKSSSPEVQQYAQMMIQEHTLSTQQLTQLAAQRGMTLPTEPSEFQQAVIDRLMQLSGAEFDRAYMEAQANGHIQTVGVFRSEVGQGQDAGLQQFAAQLLPTIEGHYQMASQISGQASALNIQRPMQ